MVDGFIKGLSGVFMALLPLAILWYVLTGTSVLGMDVVANISSLLGTLTNGGFIGLVVLVIVCSFFTKK
jgi:hypothetical protein